MLLSLSQSGSKKPKLKYSQSVAESIKKALCEKLDIRPFDYGEPRENEHDYYKKLIGYLVTKEQLIALNFTGVTDAMVAELNRVQKKYNILNMETVRHFLAQVMQESNNWNKEGLGDAIIEMGDDKYLTRYDGKSGNKSGTDDYKTFRGSGYLHLTGRYNYQKFSDHIATEYGADPLIMSEGYSRIASTYAWESAGWYWSILRPSQGFNLNGISSSSIVTRTVNDNGEMKAVTGSDVVFDVTYNVNGGYNGIENRMAYYELVKKVIK